jgi:hypothetical protein
MVLFMVTMLGTSNLTNTELLFWYPRSLRTNYIQPAGINNCLSLTYYSLLNEPKLRSDISCVSLVFFCVFCLCQFKRSPIPSWFVSQDRWRRGLYFSPGVVNTQACKLRDFCPSAQLLVLTVNQPIHTLVSNSFIPMTPSYSMKPTRVWYSARSFSSISKYKNVSKALKIINMACLYTINIVKSA